MLQSSKWKSQYERVAHGWHIAIPPGTWSLSSNNCSLCDEHVFYSKLNRGWPAIRSGYRPVLFRYVADHLKYNLKSSNTSKKKVESKVLRHVEQRSLDGRTEIRSRECEYYANWKWCLVFLKDFSESKTSTFFFIYFHP